LIEFLEDISKAAVSFNFTKYDLDASKNLAKSSSF